MLPRDYIIALISHGLSQAQIGEKTGLSQTSISRLQRGLRDDMKVSKYELLKALHAKTCGKRRAKVS